MKNSYGINKEISDETRSKDCASDLWHKEKHSVKDNYF